MFRVECRAVAFFRCSPKQNFFVPVINFINFLFNVKIIILVHIIIVIALMVQQKGFAAVQAFRGLGQVEKNCYDGTQRVS